MRSFKLFSISLLSVLGFVFVLTLTAPATANVTDDLYITVMLNDTRFDLPLIQGPDHNGIYVLETPNASGEVTDADGKTLLSFKMDHTTLDSDPFIFYDVTFTNNTASTASFSYTTPVPAMSISIPAGPTVIDNASLSYNLFDGITGAADGITIAPSGTYIQETYIGTPNTLLIGLDTTGTTINDGNHNHTGTPINVGPMPGPTGPWTSLYISTAITLTPYDQVQISGSTTFNAAPAPIPPTGVLLLFGLVGMVGLKKKLSSTNNE